MATPAEAGCCRRSNSPTSFRNGSRHTRQGRRADATPDIHRLHLQQNCMRLPPRVSTQTFISGRRMMSTTSARGDGSRDNSRHALQSRTTMKLNFDDDSVSQVISSPNDWRPVCVQVCVCVARCQYSAAHISVLAPPPYISRIQYSPHSQPILLQTADAAKCRHQNFMALETKMADASHMLPKYEL